MPNNRYMVCRDCGFNYFHNTAAAVAGILIYENQILLNVRNTEPGKGKLDLVGGFADFDETLEQALTRETKEELGININNWQYLCSFPNTYLYKDVTYHTMDAVFFHELTLKPSLKLQTTEVSNAVWMSLDEISLADFAFVSLARALKCFIKDKKQL